MKTKVASLALLLTLIFPIMAKSQVKIQQTAGRDALGEFAPEFARLNDDILFGEVWSRNNLLSLRDRSIVTVVALYDRPQVLPLPDMYGKNLTFKTGGVDGCDCAEILRLIEEGKIDTMPLITHRFPLNEIEEAYRIFENKLDGVMKVAVSEREKKGIRVIRV